MVKLRLRNASSTKEKDASMPATPSNGQVDPPFRLGLRFRPHDGSTRAQDRDFVKLSNAPAKVPMHWRDLPASNKKHHAERLFESIVAAFKDVEQEMTVGFAVKLKEALMQTLDITSTNAYISKARVSTMMPYQRLAGKHGIKKELYYPDWFFMATWLGPGHPFLEDIRKDMSDHWGVEFPTDAIVYPKYFSIGSEERLFYGEIISATNQDSIEERAKTIKKTINDSSVNGLSAAIKDHLPDALKHFGDAGKVYASEKSLASTNRELEHARKQVTDLEKQLAEAKTSQARAQEKMNSDMQALRKEIRQLKAAQGSSDNIKKDAEALRVALTQRVTGIEAKVEKDISTLRNEVAQSSEKAEKAVETGALVLSVLSTPGGQKRKMDELS